MVPQDGSRRNYWLRSREHFVGLVGVSVNVSMAGSIKKCAGCRKRCGGIRIWNLYNKGELVQCFICVCV
jgi:hypothetical protein